MTDIIERAREALDFSDSLISNDELHDIAPALARIAIAADELANRVQRQQDGFPMAPDYVSNALAAFKAAKETDQ